MNPAEPNMELSEEDVMAATRLIRTDVPGVYRRGEKYVFTYRDALGKQRWGTASTKRGARDRKRRREGGASIDLAQAKVAFGGYVDEFLTTYSGRTARGFSDSTRDRYRALLARPRIYFDVVRGLPLAAIRPRDVKACLQWLAQQPNERKPDQLLSAATLRDSRMVLRVLFAEAVQDELVASNPVADVRVNVDTGPGSGRPEPREVRAMTRAELSRLLGFVRTDWLLFHEFLAHTGLRWGEAIELRWDRDVHFGARPHIKVNYQRTKTGKIRRPKGGHVREIPLSPSMARRLWQLRQHSGAPEHALVFPSKAGTHLGRNNYCRDVLDPACDQAGLQWVTPHVFRHTCASFLFAAGRNVKQVQVWLGHADPGFTLKTYIHLIDDGVGDAAFLDDMVHTDTPHHEPSVPHQPTATRATA